MRKRAELLATTSHKPVTVMVQSSENCFEKAHEKGSPISERGREGKEVMNR
jgi:hypothetical protein